MGLAKKTSIGILWNFAEQLARRGLGAFITLLLAKFLTPEDYGLVAMMAVFIAIAGALMDSGFSNALIRLKDATQSDINTAFYSNFVLGIFSYLFLYLTAPYIDMFYKETRLTELVRVAGLAIMINSFQMVQMVMLSRALNFKNQLKATLPAAIISGLLAVWMAYAGLGVWALIAQSLMFAFITTLLLWNYNPWRPSLSFSIVSFKSMYRFGYKLFISGLLDTIFQNLYIISIAKYFTTIVAGHYFFASKIKEIIISQVVGSIQNVTYPALSSLQDDNIRLKNGYRKIVAITSFLLFPLILITAALAEPLFKVFLPDKWLPAVPYMQLMCLEGVIYPLHSINLNILKVKGRSDLFFYLEVIKKIIIVVVLSISIKYGVLGILIGQIIFSVLAYVPNSLFSSKLIHYTIREQVKDILPTLLLSGFSAVCVYGLVCFFEWYPLIKLIVFGTCFCIFYIACAHILKLQAYEIGKRLLHNKFTSKRIQ